MLIALALLSRCSCKRFLLRYHNSTKKPGLSDIEKGKIRAYAKLGMSQREIARRVNRSKTVAQHFLKDKEQYGMRYKGRSTATITRATKRRIFQLARTGRASCADIVRILQLRVTPRRIAQIVDATPLTRPSCTTAAPQHALTPHTGAREPHESLGRSAIVNEISLCPISLLSWLVGETTVNRVRAELQVGIVTHSSKRDEGRTKQVDARSSVVDASD